MNGPPPLPPRPVSTSPVSTPPPATQTPTTKEAFDTKIQRVREQLFNVAPRLEGSRTPAQAQLLNALGKSTREELGEIRQIHTATTKLTRSFAYVSGELATYEQRIQETRNSIIAEEKAAQAHLKVSYYIPGAAKRFTASSRKIEKLEIKLIQYETKKSAVQKDATLLQAALNAQSTRIDTLSQRAQKLKNNFNSQYQLAGDIRFFHMDMKQQVRGLVKEQRQSDAMQGLRERLTNLEQACATPLKSEEIKAKKEEFASIKQEFQNLEKTPKASVSKRLSQLFTRSRSGSESATPTRARAHSAPPIPEGVSPLEKSFRSLQKSTLTKQMALELQHHFRAIEHDANPSTEKLYDFKNAVLQKMKANPEAKEGLKEVLTALNPLIDKANDAYVSHHTSTHLTGRISELSKVKQSIVEIGTTEVSFNKGLKQYQAFLDDLNTQGKISAEDYSTLTKGLSEAIQSSDALIQRLLPNLGEAPIDLNTFGKDPLHSVFNALGGSSFAAHIDRLGTVTDNYGQALGVINRLTKDPNTRSLILDFENPRTNPTNTTGSLSSFAILAPQRAMRYKSLIEASQDYAKKDQEIVKEFSKLLTSITPLVAELNAR